MAGQLDGLFGDTEFGQVGAPRQLLDRRAVLVARKEIERGEIGALAQQRVDAADALEPHRPVDVVDEAQAADDVAGGDIAAGQRAMLGNDDFLGVGAGFLELDLQPFQRPAGILRAVAQAVEQLGGEGGVLRMRAVARQDLPAVCIVVGRQHAVGDLVGDMAHLPGAVDAHGDAAQILDQNEAQQRRQRPQFADLERLDRLKTLDDGFEHGRRNRTVGMGDIAPGQGQRARHRGAVGHFQGRQLPVETTRQVALHLKNGLLDEIIVVEQPLRGRRDGFALGLGGIGRAVDFEDFLGAVADAGLEIELRQAEQVLDVALGEAFAQRAQPLFGQEIGAYRLFGDDREAGAGLFDMGRICLDIH
ncbi:hypothetical protein X770_25465 [Mesorhizobium sp. LSJC269B00]|uniref:hypothetical protein n=1 Tax=Mesorhizobium sp. LSJC269B00 TaxID=1287326 RepID=UPI0003CF5B07|nr:hypothetical protein [Mesorhizobium sp. LSJC269B00]ESW83944.1 hypothetical protein X770_25465 [Mesorhizobium sp. LSJC269B00]